MINRELVQQEYGFLGNMIHVNACAVGVPPMRTQQAACSFMEQYLPIVYDANNLGFHWLRQKVRRQIAGLINGKADEIAFTKNTTEGTATLAWGYPLGPGDNVVVADLENPSNLYPWVYAAKVKGFAVKLIRTDGRGVSLRQYLDAIDGNTKVVAVSLVQAGSGARVDLAALGRVCREKGIVLSVDAVQGFGRIAVDVDACCVDFLTCGGFKVLGAGFGIGFIYCREALAPMIRPLIIGDGSMESELNAPEVYDENVPTVFLANAERFEGGTSNALGIWLLHHSLSVMEDLGAENIHRYVLELEEKLREKLSGCGLDVLPPGDLPSGVVVAWYPAENYEQAEAILKKYDIHISHHEGYLRLSIAVHNTEAQMQQVATAFWEIGSLVGR